MFKESVVLTTGLALLLQQKFLLSQVVEVEVLVKVD
jgi:hypothetical protein